MTATVIPAFDHIFIVILENHGFEEIIGSPDAPFTNGVATIRAADAWR